MSDSVELGSVCSGIRVSDRPDIRTGTVALPIRQVKLRCSKPNALDYPLDPKTLGEHLRKRRLDLGLIQKEVALRIGGCVASVWLWEKNQAEPELKWMPAIVEFLGYNPLRQSATDGERLVAFRTVRGWSQKRLAAELRVDPTTLSRWELGKKRPWGAYVDRVKALLGRKWE